jgi:DNA-binding MarR family transcriptional regulator
VADDLRFDEEVVELRSVLGALYRRLRQTRAPGELSGPEGSALSRLERQGAMAAAELARLEQISPQSIAVTLQSLVESGLVERRPDPADGRRVILSISDAGRGMVSGRRAARTEQLAQALAALDPEERERLRAALPALRRLAREL